MFSHRSLSGHGPFIITINSYIAFQLLVVGHTPRAALAEASSTGSRCRFNVHLSNCYYTLFWLVLPVQYTTQNAAGANFWIGMCPRATVKLVGRGILFMVGLTSFKCEK